jgi:hypothetical protein
MTNIPAILLVVVVMLGTMVFFSMKNIDLNPKIHTSGKNKTVELEAFDNKTKNKGDVLEEPADHFCEEMKGKSHELETHCNSFSEQSCKFSSCCVYASIDGSEKCMAGGADGPTFGRNDDGTKKNIDYYYYNRKCYGDKCD